MSWPEFYLEKARRRGEIMEEIEDPREIEALRNFFEEERLLALHKHMTDYLMKIGIKLRKHKWNEHEAA